MKPFRQALSLSQALRATRRRIVALRELQRLLGHFGAERLISDLPHIRECMERYDRLIPPQEAGLRRFDLINAAISRRRYETYLEIGVRDPQDCFNRVMAARKWSVDPGLEFRSNPVDFAMTSDEFFARCDAGQVSNRPTAWDVIFIDGLHRAEQVWRDIQNASRYLAPSGMIFLHDCLPPSEVFARERFEWALESRVCWNGTCWKALSRYMESGPWHSVVVETDWGVGVIDSARVVNRRAEGGENVFFEFDRYVHQLRQAGLVMAPHDFVAGLG